MQHIEQAAFLDLQFIVQLADQPHAGDISRVEAAAMLAAEIGVIGFDAPPGRNKAELRG
jgi:hypothetical protein